MAISLGSTTYTTVTWTTGDIATEAKMDNMVANDQAYDSHAAQGILLNNAKGLFIKESGGTNRLAIGVDTDNYVYVGTNDVLGHTVLNAGSSKLVKLKALRQNNTTNVYEPNTVFLHGWGFITSAGTPNVTEDVTFGITFQQEPNIVVTCAGISVGSDPTDIGDLTNGGTTEARTIMAMYKSTTTTQFTVALRAANGATIASGDRVGYTWVAIGELDT